MEDEVDGKGRANFYAHQRPSEVSNLPWQASLRQFRNREEVPLNFIGRKALRTPDAFGDECMFCPRPMAGVWRAVGSIPLMRTLPVTPRCQ